MSYNTIKASVSEIVGVFIFLYIYIDISANG